MFCIRIFCRGKIVNAIPTRQLGIETDSLYLVHCLLHQTGAGLLLKQQSYASLVLP